MRKAFGMLCHLVAKLASHIKPLSPKGKISKLLKTVPVCLAPAVMVAEATEVLSKMFIASFKDKISWRMKQDLGKASPPLAAPVYYARNLNGRSLEHRQVSKNKRDVSYVCGKLGHFANKCWHRNSITH